MANSQPGRSTRFSDLLIERLRKYEKEEEGFYEDNRGIFTIGIGYTPIVFGNSGWVLRPRLGQHFRDIGAPLSKRQITALGDAAAEDRAGGFRNAKTRAALNELRSIKLNKSQAADLTLKVMPEFTGVVERTLGRRKWDFLQRNAPLAAAEMVTMAYQSPRNFVRHGREIADLALASRPNPFNNPPFDGTDGVQEGKPMANPLRTFHRKRLVEKLTEAGRIDPPRYTGSIAALFEPDERDVVQVGQGELLSRIARDNGVDPAELVAANQEVLGEPGKLRAGATLNLFGLRRRGEVSEQKGSIKLPIPRPRPPQIPVPKPRPLVR